MELHNRIMSFLTKLVSIIKWLLIMLIYGILYPLAYIVYPLSYNTRKWTRKIRYSNKSWWYIVPLWVFLDDEEDYGEGEIAWFKANKGRLDTAWQRFRISYLWAVTRNHAWNFHSLCGLNKDDEKQLISTKGEIKRKGIVVDDPYRFATLRYEDDNGNWTGHKGKWLSWNHSDLGSRFTWYKIGNKLCWRYSFANKIKWLNRWIELHLGMTDNRYTVRFKIKNTQFKPIEHE